jgi:hypothetical protein
VRIKRYLVMVAALVGMGLATVWWKSRTVAMGYDVVRVERDLKRAEEERRLEDSRVARMTSPNSMEKRVRELKLDLKKQERLATRSAKRRGDGGSRVVIVVRR